MTPDRRDLLRTGAVAAAGLALGGSPSSLTGLAPPRTSQRSSRAEEPARRIRLLILGGTGFIGPYQVRYAMKRGHQVTIFNRGRTAPDMFPGVETLIGDRNGDLDALTGRSWDVVIDNARANPRWVELTADLLNDSVDRYFFVSSRSAYADTLAVPMTADHPTYTYETAGVERGAESLPYGLAKAESERALMTRMPGRSTIFRPGLIIGPGDDTDRFTYWPVRIRKGGEVLAPGDPEDPVQIIDVRDLTEWMIRMAEDENTGVYNVVGPATPRPMAELLYGIRAVTTAETRFTWVKTDFLDEMGVRPYSDLPVWMPPRSGREGFARFDLSDEVAKGLTYRSLAVTARDTLDFHLWRPSARQAELRAGITREREREVLEAWHRQSSGGRGPR